MITFDPSGIWAGLKYEAFFPHVYSWSPQQNSLNNSFFSPCVGHALSTTCRIISNTCFSAHSSYLCPQTSSVRPNIKHEYAVAADCFMTAIQMEMFTRNCKSGSWNRTGRCSPRLALLPTEGNRSPFSFTFLPVNACLVHYLMVASNTGEKEPKKEIATHKGQRKCLKKVKPKPLFLATHSHLPCKNKTQVILRAELIRTTAG